MHLSRMLWLAPIAFGVAACGEPKPSLAESLAAKPEEEFKYEKREIKRPDGLPPPTKSEFAAWNRKDAGGEKHLYKWDKANLSKMLNYWEELTCLKDKMVEEGKKAYGAEPGSPKEENWYQFKRAFIPHVNGWQQRLFANEPRILEKSKFIGNFLEAHELVMNGYPDAFNGADDTGLKKQEAHWLIVEAKIKKYVKNLGSEWNDFLADTPKAQKAHANVCEAALKPPDTKEKKRRKKKSPI